MIDNVVVTRWRDAPYARFTKPHARCLMHRRPRLIFIAFKRAPELDQSDLWLTGTTTGGQIAQLVPPPVSGLRHQHEYGQGQFESLLFHSKVHPSNSAVVKLTTVFVGSRRSFLHIGIVKVCSHGAPAL